MATRTLGPGSLTIGQPASSREWGGECSKTAITPNTSSEDSTPMLDGSELTGEDTNTYTLDVTVADNFDFDSLQNFSMLNAGKELPFLWVPNDEGGSSYSGMVKVRPIKIGGDVKKRNFNDVSMPITGTPTIGENV
jgi:hypothetical protein